MGPGRNKSRVSTLARKDELHSSFIKFVLGNKCWCFIDLFADFVGHTMVAALVPLWKNIRFMHSKCGTRSEHR